MKVFKFSSLLFLVFLLSCFGERKKLLTEVQATSLDSKIIYTLDGQPYTGILQDKTDEILKRELSVENGYLNGPTIIFFYDGSVADIKEYKHGILHGISRRYSANSIIQEDYTFKNGRKEGFQFIHFPSGAINKKLFYKNGYITGANQIFYLDGQLLQEFFFDNQGKRDSIWRKYYPNGKVKEEIIYNHGSLVKPAVRFDDRGIIIN